MTKNGGAQTEVAAEQAEGTQRRSDPRELLLKWGFAIFVTGMALVGAIAGRPLADFIGGFIQRWVETTNLLYFTLGIQAVCALAGFLVGIRTFRWLVQSVSYLEQMPLLDKGAAAIGVLLGLTIALLATMPFSSIPGVGLGVR
ncbi:MAG: hypothetical protein H5T86_03375, partial [Armatimonadetes bacterium]|nr:hypothetical protein [Armatimonadota bacterium]